MTAKRSATRPAWALSSTKLARIPAKSSSSPGRFFADLPSAHPGTAESAGQCHVDVSRWSERLWPLDKRVPNRRGAHSATSGSPARRLSAGAGVARPHAGAGLAQHVHGSARLPVRLPAHDYTRCWCHRISSYRKRRMQCRLGTAHTSRSASRAYHQARGTVESRRWARAASRASHRPIGARHGKESWRQPSSNSTCRPTPC